MESAQTFGRTSKTTIGGAKAGVPSGCDKLVLSGIVALVVLSPLGPLIRDERALQIAEIGVFAISAIWAGKTLWMRSTSSEQQSAIEDWKLFVPLGALFLWFVVQLIPLPPALVRIFSPATYQVYEKSLAGWPSAHPYGGLIAGSSGLSLPVWRPLSLCTELTLSGALRFSCFSALMAISAFYSFGGSRDREIRFVRRTAIGWSRSLQ